MDQASPDRRLIVNADDFGRSPSINCAVIRAHEEGILTTASLMVNEPACDEAVRLARAHPRLGVGLHLSLVCGKSALPHAQIPSLVDAGGNFSNNAPATGMRYFFNSNCRADLEKEITAQFQRFHATGLPLDHVNGHLHMHLHPVVFRILLRHAREWNIRHVRLTNDYLALNLKAARGKWLYRLSHFTIYRLLSSWARPHFRRHGFRCTNAVFGLLQDSRVDKSFLARLLPALPPGDSELYSHPSLDQFKHEFDALISPSIVGLVKQQGISLIRYQDL